MAPPLINTFDDDASRRIAETVRRSEGMPYAPASQPGGNTSRGLQVRFGITVDGGEAYPASPSTVFWWKPVERKPASLALGDQAITDTPHAEGKRKGVSVNGKFIPEDVVCLAFKIGGYWWLYPVAGLCDVIPPLWSQIEGYVAANSQMIVKAADECPELVDTGPC